MISCFLPTLLAHLDTGVVTDFDIFDELTPSDYDTSTLVTSNKRKLGCQWPVAMEGVKVGMTYTRELDVAVFISQKLEVSMSKYVKAYIKTSSGPGFGTGICL